MLPVGVVPLGVYCPLLDSSFILRTCVRGLPAWCCFPMWRQEDTAYNGGSTSSNHCPTGGLVRGITAGLCCGSCIPSFTTKVCIGEEYTNAPNLLSPRWGRNSIDSSVQPLSATNYTGIIFNPSNKYKHTYTVPRTFDPGPRSLRMTCRAVWDMSPVTGRGASMARHKARMDRPMGPRPSERRASGVQGKG